MEDATLEKRKNRQSFGPNNVPPQPQALHLDRLHSTHLTNGEQQVVEICGRKVQKLHSPAAKTSVCFNFILLYL